MILRRLSLILLSCSALNTGFALPSDRHQPLFLHADHALLNSAQHTAHYAGHVHIEQGSTRASGNTLDTISNQQNQLQQLLLRGENAHYQTTPERHKPILYTQARQIKDDRQQHQVTFTQQAQAQRAGNVLAGPVIYYDPLTKTVHTPNNHQQQTVIHLTPTENQHS